MGRMKLRAVVVLSLVSGAAAFGTILKLDDDFTLSTEAGPSNTQCRQFCKPPLCGVFKCGGQCVRSLVHPMFTGLFPFLDTLCANSCVSYREVAAYECYAH